MLLLNKGKFYSVYTHAFMKSVIKIHSFRLRLIPKTAVVVSETINLFSHCKNPKQNTNILL